MALVADGVYQITVHGSVLGEQVANVWYAQLSGSPAPGDNETMLGEAWWNHVKAEYRNVATTAYPTAFLSVAVEQCGTGVRGFGVYSIPPGERPGLRTVPAAEQPQTMPSFSAAGMRLNVGTRLTRPGQKRFWGLAEQDNNAGTLQSSAVTALVALGNRMMGTLTLGAPLALMTLFHVIRKSAPLDHVNVVQPITTFSLPTTVRSQVSRRPRAF